MTEIPTKIVVNCETGVQEILPLTESEIAQRELDAQAHAEAELARQAEETAKAAAKADAVAALVALGLTEAQVQALTA